MKDFDLTYSIIDDFLDDESFNNLSDTMLGDNFPWFYNDRVVSEKDKSHFQFTHNFYSEYCPRSNLFNLLIPILKKLNPKSLVRVKANTTTRTDKHIIHGQHTDFPFTYTNAYTSLFYLNTNNGGTVFEEGDVVDSFENRLVTFPMHEKHSGKTCTNEKRRVIINFNYFK